VQGLPALARRAQRRVAEPGQFTEDPASVVGGHQVDDRELRRAVATLDARDLIDGVRIDEDRMLARVYLTSADTLAVNEYDGDLPAWRNATGSTSMCARRPRCSPSSTT
jgi:hypothetical protein